MRPSVVSPWRGDPTEVTMVEEPDKRRQRRQRVLKGAAIINGINNSEISCTIKTRIAVVLN